MLFTDTERNNISKWEYKVNDTSITTKIFTPFWNYVASYVPDTVAPNILSLAGLLCILYAYNISCLSISPLIYILIAFLTFSYMTLDAIDGKHARRTNNASPLGEIFDHMCDAIGLTFIILTFCNVSNITNSMSQWHIVQLCQLIFMSYHIYAFKTKKIIFSSIAGPGEPLIVYIIYLIILSYDNTISKYPIVIEQITIGLYYISLLLILLQIIRLGKNNTSSINGLIICIIIKLIPLFIKAKITPLSIIADGLMTSIITCDIILSKMANRQLHPWIIIITMISLFDSFISIIVSVFYIGLVIYEISHHLEKPILTPERNILCLGYFDCCHIGHKKMFLNAIALGTRLFVGVHSDNDAILDKPDKKMIMSMDERIEEVKYSKGVSHVIPNAPLYVSKEFLQQYNIHIVVCEESYYNDPNDKYYTVPREMGILRPLPRTNGMSTTTIRKRIYDLVKSGKLYFKEFDEKCNKTRNNAHNNSIKELHPYPDIADYDMVDYDVFD